MATAILEGAQKAGVIDPDRLVVADPNPDKRARFRVSAESAAEALAKLQTLETTPGEGAIMLAIKPQVLPQIAPELAPTLAEGHPSRLLLSILAGTTNAALAALGPAARPIRVMPNTPAQVARGMTALAPSPSATPEDLTRARALFQAVGQTIDLPEDLIDAFTALAGSGPAYVFLLTEAMANAAESLGLSKPEAARIARATVAGAGALLDADPRPAEELRKAVTSKGGTTAAALDTFEQGNLRDLVTKALTAARDRGRELGNG